MMWSSEEEENQGRLQGFNLRLDGGVIYRDGEPRGRSEFQGQNRKFRFGHVKSEILIGNTSGEFE